MDTIYRSKFTPTSAPVPANTTSNKCQNTSTVVPTCSEIGYSKAFIPNFRMAETQESLDRGVFTDFTLEDSRRELNDFQPLIETGCSNAIAHLLCSVYAPQCYTDSQNSSVRLHPCKELCLYVRSGCEGILTSFGMEWPQHLDCSNTQIYKPGNSTTDMVYCPADLPTLQIPRNIVPSSPPPTGTPPENQVIVITPPMETVGTCESISAVPTCAHLGYTSAYFPNLRQQTLSQANNELRNLQPLLESNCSELLPHLLCSVSAPFCYINRTSNAAARLQPCVELCHFVRASCEPVLRQHNLQWPSHLDCGNNQIYRPNDSLSYCPTNFSLSRNPPTQATPIAQSTPTAVSVATSRPSEGNY